MDYVWSGWRWKGEIFQNYDLILCEKCNHKIDGYPYYCKSCYEKETGVERSRIKYSKCKECFQVLTRLSLFVLHS